MGKKTTIPHLRSYNNLKVVLLRRLHDRIVREQSALLDVLVSESTFVASQRTRVILDFDCSSCYHVAALKT